MVKRMTVMWIVLIFAFSSVLFVASCAKKQTKTEEAAPKPAALPAPKAEAPRPSAPAKGPTDAERLAMEREVERAQRLRAEMLAFESEHIYFDYDRSEVKPEAQEILKKKAEWLKKNSQFQVKIEGHCDERGTNEYNLALGDRRAQAAAKFLGALGIATNKISTISFGEERPADPGHDEKAWAKNRRDEFKLSK